VARRRALHPVPVTGSRPGRPPCHRPQRGARGKGDPTRGDRAATPRQADALPRAQPCPAVPRGNHALAHSRHRLRDPAAAPRGGLMTASSRSHGSPGPPRCKWPVRAQEGPRGAQDRPAQPWPWSGAGGGSRLCGGADGATRSPPQSPSDPLRGPQDAAGGPPARPVPPVAERLPPPPPANRRLPTAACKPPPASPARRRSARFRRATGAARTRFVPNGGGILP
jgi:hypothetical protein